MNIPITPPPAATPRITSSGAQRALLTIARAANEYIDDVPKTITQMRILVKGTVKASELDRFYRALGKRYADRIAEFEKKVPIGAKNRASEIGKLAADRIAFRDLPELAEQYGIPKQKLSIEPEWPKYSNSLKIRKLR
jgi:hypothetical protein